MVEIIIDDREDNKLIQMIEKENIKYKVQRLDCFDYIIGDELAIEYKSINDFIGSSYGHLQEQIKNMLENLHLVKRILIVICGNYDDLFWMKYRINEASYIGMLSSITIKYKVSILHFKRPQQFVKYLASCLSKLESNNEIDTTKLKRLESKDNTELSLLCALPSISITKAQKILQNYNIKLILTDKENNGKTVEELKNIDGIGKGIVKNLKNYFIQ